MLHRNTKVLEVRLTLGQVRVHSSGKSITYQQQKAIEPRVDFKRLNGPQPGLLVLGVHGRVPDVSNRRM